MRKRASLIVEIVKIIINCIIVPLYFIKFFCDEALLPGFNENGEQIIHRHYYYYSIFDKIAREGIAFLLWGAIALIVVSITLSVLTVLIKKNKSLIFASHIAFGISVFLFFVLLFIAGSIRYGY